MGVISYCGINVLDNDISDTIQKNELIANLYQREIDHLGWAAKVSEMLIHSQGTSLQVETDPHKCAFGKWYDSEERAAAEKQMPQLAPLLAKIENPHMRLHTSAIEIDKNYKQKEFDQAKSVFVNKTLPALAEVRTLLKESGQIAKDNVASVNENVIRAAVRIQWMLLYGSVIAVVVGAGLGYLISNGITKALHAVIERLRHGAEEAADQ